jgi:hypothetical protein
VPRDRPPETEVAVPEQKDPFRRPQKKSYRPGPWNLVVEFGLAVPMSGADELPGAGVFVSLRGGRRIMEMGTFSLWVGLDVSMHSLRGDDEVVLNPDDPPESQVKCEDDKGLTLWTFQGSLAAEWRWSRFSLRAAGFGGGGLAEYTQLSRVAPIDGNGDALLQCTTAEWRRWVPAAGGWVRGGWAFTRKAEAGLVAGATAVFSSKQFEYETSTGTRKIDVLPHLFHVGVYFTHRF